MTWPTDDLTTANTDQGTDNPSLARSDFYNLINKVKSILANRGVTDGIADLDANGKVPNARLNLGVAGGAASLDGAGKVPLGQLPTGSGNGLDADTLDGNEASVFAKLASPAFTGTPTAPTQASGDNSTKLANTAFVQQELAGYQGVQVGMLMGTVSSGGTIPLPSGYTESQCKWIASISDIHGDSSGDYNSGSYVSLSGRTVTVYGRYDYGNNNGVANYLIIGVK